MTRQKKFVEATVVANKVIEHRDQAEEKAWKALAGYKFQMFGYWAAIYVHLTQTIGDNKPNPFRELVLKARENV